MVSPLSLRSPDDIPPAFVPYPRPHPSIDDRVTSEMFRQRDNAIREHRNAAGRPRHPYPQRQSPRQGERRQPAGWRIPARMPQSPYPPRKRPSPAELEEWDDVAKEDHDNGIAEEDNGAPARPKGKDERLDEVKQQYRKDVAKGETAVEEGSVIKNPFDDPKTGQHPKEPFADYQSGYGHLESFTTAANSEFGQPLEPMRSVQRPFTDPEDHDSAPAPASGPCVTLSWKSSDKIQDYGSPSRNEDDGVIIEARTAAKLLRESAACDCENVLRTESLGLRGMIRSGRAYMPN